MFCLIWVAARQKPNYSSSCNCAFDSKVQLHEGKITKFPLYIQILGVITNFYRGESVVMVG